MEGGEISPLDAESSYQKFRKELQAFSLEVNGMDEDERKMCRYRTTSFGKLAAREVSAVWPHATLVVKLHSGAAAIMHHAPVQLGPAQHVHHARQVATARCHHAATLNLHRTLLPVPSTT